MDYLGYSYEEGRHIFFHSLNSWLQRKTKAVEVHIPVQFTGASRDENVLVDTNSYQYWVHRSVISSGQIIARAIIAYADPKKCLIQIFDKQFWCDNKYIVKKL